MLNGIDRWKRIDVAISKEVKSKVYHTVKYSDNEYGMSGVAGLVDRTFYTRVRVKFQLLERVII